MITAKDNQYLKLMGELLRKKYRRRHGLFLAEGRRLIGDLRAAGFCPYVVLYGESFNDIALLERLANVTDSLFMVRDELLATVTDTENSQRIVAAFPLPCGDLASFLQTPRRLLLVASGIRDPGNLGTILRTAAAAGADGLIVEEGSVDLFNPKAVRACMGALARVPVFYDLPAAEIGALLDGAGYHVFVADMAGDTRYDELPVTKPCAVILGGEAAGAAAYWQKSRSRVFIPLANQVESLNVAAASAVIAFDFRRRLENILDDVIK